MIVKLLCARLFNLIRLIIKGISVTTFLPNSLVDTITMLIKAMQFFPFDVWFLVIGCIIFWAAFHIGFGLVNFILKFLPIINIGQ